DFWLSCS
ncbi:L-lysine 2,3-aminomutase, partial [Haemophilus influenzae]